MGRVAHHAARARSRVLPRTPAQTTKRQVATCASRASQPARAVSSPEISGTKRLRDNAATRTAFVSREKEGGKSRVNMGKRWWAGRPAHLRRRAAANCSRMTMRVWAMALISLEKSINGKLGLGLKGQKAKRDRPELPPVKGETNRSR